MLEQELSPIDPMRPIAAFDGHVGAAASAAIDAASLADALDAIPDDAFSRERVVGLTHAGGGHPLALDVLETEGLFEIHASVPGIDPAALDIMVLGESVRIAGSGVTAETPHVSEEADYRWLLRERPVGRFDRTVSLPSPILPEAAAASVQDGVLIVTLPKAPRVGSVRIPVLSLPVLESADAAVIDLDS